MDEKRIQSALEDALEEKIPSANVHLWPRVKAGFAAGNTYQRKKMNTQQRRTTFAALAMIFLLALVLITPQGRALAQRMFQFFTVNDQKSFPLPTDQAFFPAPPTSTPPAAHLLVLEAARPGQAAPTAAPDAGCTSPEAQGSYTCQVKAVEDQAGFNAREFLYDPKGMKFSTASYVPATGEIDMEFVVITGGGYLYLRQGISDFPEQTSTWGTVPSDAVEEVTVNGQYAEIASGTYIVYPNATSAVWEPGPLKRSLAWRDGSRWFVLEKMGDPYPIEWITKDELIKLAEGLVDERPAGTVPPLDPEYLTTVEQAEALAGFDIPTPALLPAGFELKRVVWTDHTARLIYGPSGTTDSELFVFVSPIADFQAGPCSECPPGVTEAVQVGPWSGWYWRGIYQTFPVEEGQPTPAPVWHGDAAHWSLTWSSEAYSFSMFYSPAYNSGREVNKELLAEIAGSLK